MSYIREKVGIEIARVKLNKDVCLYRKFKEGGKVKVDLKVCDLSRLRLAQEIRRKLV